MSKSRSQAPSSPSARDQALTYLLRIEQAQAFVGFQAKDGEDRRLQRQIREYVAGVTRWQRWLDFVIDHFYRGKAQKLEPALRHILRLGVYELLYQATPPHAAINEAVRLAKRRVRRQAGGLVNGVLRAIQRQQDQLPHPTKGSKAERLAIRHSHPTWLVQRWLKQFGEASTEGLLVWNNARPTYGVRANLLQHTAQAFRADLKEAAISFKEAHFLDVFVRMQSLQGVVQSGWLSKGQCSVQDEAAGLVVHLLDPQPEETIIDVCAAPGGKAFFMAERMANTGEVHVWDIHERRLNLVTKGGKERGYTTLRPKVVDMAQPLALDVQADRVLVDAPCTGTGVLAKRADLRWNRAEHDLAALCTLQHTILTNAATLVKPGGILVYSTCSIEQEENEAQVVRFLSEHPDFVLEPAGTWLAADVVTEEGYYFSLPHVQQMDGAFAARLRRRI